CWRYLQSDLPHCLRFARSPAAQRLKQLHYVRTYALSL
ncbi:hypothetical protein AVDCRST_MAG84-710, partial [uncultured Microcoleus sp.]